MSESETDLLQEISHIQHSIIERRETRAALEANIASIDREIDEDVLALSELQERLNQSIAAATHKAVGG